MTSTTPSFGDRLEWLMRVAGVSARELATLAGVSHGYAAAAVRQGNAPRLEILLAIARLFGADPLWLGAGQNSAPEPGAVQEAVSAARQAHADSVGPPPGEAANDGEPA